MHDPMNLQRFLTLQDPVYDDALAALRGGTMCTPFMPFIFPRLAGTAAVAGVDEIVILSLDEARAYLAFPVLGGRYRECVEALTWFSSLNVEDIFGDVESRHLQASLTLFAEASSEPLLRAMLAIWFAERVDEDTIVRIRPEF